jgi:Zn-dependent protease with chaperone function
VDFFERQEQVRKKTKLLVCYFSVAVGLIVIALNAVVFSIYCYSYVPRKQGGSLAAHAADDWYGAFQAALSNHVFTVTSLVVLGVVFLGSFFRTNGLKSGGSSVALMMGGRSIDPSTSDPKERQLMNVVEEMAIASGVPVPEVFVIDNEAGINAFASGWNSDDAAIAVTHGTLQVMTRDELQGIVGHEFSHILNGDMRLNIRLIGILFGILLLGIIGRKILWFGPRGSRGKKCGGGIVVVGIALLILGYIGLFFGRLIKSAVSREREYLADASAVQFTRNPDGVAGALKKIGGAGFGSKIVAAQGEEVSHMLFASGFRSGLFGMFATHPPLETRIRAIDKRWDGKYPIVKPIEQPKYKLTEYDKKVQKKRAFRSAFNADNIVKEVGNPSPAHMMFAAAILNSISDPIRNASREPYQARALIYAILLDKDESIRQKQLEQLNNRASIDTYDYLKNIIAQVDLLGDESKLPLVDLCFPALRKMSKDQSKEFLLNIRAVVTADDKIDSFEYAISKIILMHLKKAHGTFKEKNSYHSIKGLMMEVAVVMSALAYQGKGDMEKATQRYAAGAKSLKHSSSLLSKTECRVSELDKALNKLVLASPAVKKLVIDAAAHTVFSDNNVTAREAELLRAVADAMNCPLPPLMAA